MLKNIGSALLFFGVGSMLLHLLGFEFKLLMWVDNWGETAGWGIRIGMAAVGAVMLFLASRQAQATPAAATDEAG